MPVSKHLTLWLLLGASLLATAPASAREATAAEKADLVESVEAFNAAMLDGDYATVIETIPPKVLDFIAVQAQVGVDELRAALLVQTEQAMEGLQFESFGMDLDAVRYQELPDGTPYALIPTQSTISSGDGAVESRSDTLGLHDGGEWYLVCIFDS